MPQKAPAALPRASRRRHYPRHPGPLLTFPADIPGLAKMVGRIGDGARRANHLQGGLRAQDVKFGRHSFDPAAAEELQAFECPPFPPPLRKNGHSFDRDV